jgi:hypothetical protein
MSIVLEIMVWSPFEGRFLRANVQQQIRHASIDVELNSGDVGVIIRDEERRRTCGLFSMADPAHRDTTGYSSLEALELLREP